MPRYRQLHVMLSEDEMSALKALASSLGTTASDTVRILIQAGSASPSAVEGTTLVLDRQTLARYIRNVRSLGHLLNQSTHALNAIAKAVRESGVDDLDLTEALKDVSYGLAEARRDAADVRQQAEAFIGMPVVLGE